MSVGTRPIGGEKYSVGVAYIALPSDIDRAVYVKDCYKNFRVSLITEDGGFHNRIPINPSELNFIEFPANPNQLGTAVVYATDELMQHPYVISRFAKKDELGDMKEHQFKFKRLYDGALVEISGSPKDRYINLLVSSGEKSGKLNINILSDNGDGEINVNVRGNINITSDSTILQQETSYQVTTQNGDNKASFTQTPTENKFYNDKLIINDGTEPMVLGNQLKSLFQNLIGAITKIKTVDQKPLSPDSIADIQAISSGIDEVLSKVGYLDK